MNLRAVLSVAILSGVSLGVHALAQDATRQVEQWAALDGERNFDAAADSATVDSPAPVAQQTLPNSPGTVAMEPVVTVAKASFARTGDGVQTCSPLRAMRLTVPVPDKPGKMPGACSELIYPTQPFLDQQMPIPLTWREKGYLALRDYTDPANALTIVGVSAINIAADSHTAFGPGFKGFGKLTGVSLLQSATGEFFGVFAVPSIMRQDPRYYRMPHEPIKKRFVHAVLSSYVSRADDGHRIPNYGTLTAYPAIALSSNFYVPGIETDGKSTAARILTGLGIDPTNNLLNEFVPDLAKHVHVRIIFLQNVLNNIALTNGTGMQ